MRAHPAKSVFHRLKTASPALPGLSVSIEKCLMRFGREPVCEVPRNVPRATPVQIKETTMKIMSASPVDGAMGALGPMKGRRTVDLMTRTLHALMALSFGIGYITGESERLKLLHITMGYTLGGLLLVRVLWGLWGPRPARWSVLRQKLLGFRQLLQVPTDLKAWVGRMQAPVLAASIALVLLCMAPLVLSGYVAEQDWLGWGDALGELHEAVASLMLMGVLVHLGAVVAFSFLRQKNLAWPMFTGRVRENGPDLVRNNQTVWALLLISAFMLFWGWQWLG